MLCAHGANTIASLLCYTYSTVAGESMEGVV